MPATKIDRILVVDDAPDNLLLIQTLLEEEGYQITTSDNGHTALELIADSPPDLVLTDVMMPGINGFEVTQQIRQNPELPYIPILMITANDRLKVAEGLDLGADDFVYKPIEYEELIARVRSLLRLKHSVDERDRIAHQREDFVSRLTHDLRTPLIAADRVFTLMLQAKFGQVEPEMAEMIKMMQQNQQHLLTMTNNLLEIYRYESGHKSLNFSSVRLVELIDEVAAVLLPLMQAKGLEFSQDLTALPSDLEIQASRPELRRVLMNLLENAIKFTQQGQIQVRVYPGPLLKLSPQDSRGIATICIQIQDSGSGIPEGDRLHLFQRFRKGHHAHSGSGLGLYLSREIVALHQGQLKFQPAPEGGSIFTITLPINLSS